MNTTTPTRLRRGSALMVVLIMVLVLVGLSASLFLIVRSAAAESTSIVHYGQALEYAEIAESQTLQDIIEFSPTLSGSDWNGFVEEMPDKVDGDSRTVKKTINGQSYSVIVRSGYLAHKNAAVPGTFLYQISDAERSDFSKALFDIYAIDTLTPPLGKEGYRRGIETVYEIRKLNIPAALYLEKPQVPAWNGLSWVVDGADHQLLPASSKPSTGLKMPFSGQLQMAYGGSNAGIHSAFSMIDPETGAEKQIFYDSKSPFNDWITGDGKNPLVVPAGAELDFWIHARAEAWSNGMGEYDHHAFGDTYYDPDSQFDGKAFGATWQRVQLKSGTKASSYLAEFKIDNPELAAKYPNLNLDPNKDGLIGENSEGLGTSANWSSNNEDFTGDGKVEFEKDVDSNGTPNKWFKNSRNEDLNGNGKFEDADLQLSKAIQTWFETKHAELIDHVELRLGFEDLPGWYGSNDWDYDDLVMTLNLVPTGNLKKTNPPVIQDVNYARSQGIPAIGSTMTYTDLGLTDTGSQKQSQQVRAILPDSNGKPADVVGSAAYIQTPLSVRAYAANYIGGTADKLVPNSNVQVYDTLKINGAGATDLGSKDNIKLTYVTGNGGTIAGQAEGGGVLVVEGDLHISGQFTFYGTLIVLGNLDISGGGAGIHIFGNVMVGGDFSISGQSDIWYSSESINNIFTTFHPPLGLYAVPLSWKELNNAEIKAVETR